MENDPQQASADAVSTATIHADAVENARQAQLADAVAQTAVQTRAALLEGLKEIFGGPDDKDPEHMKIIYQKIPILCIRVDAIDKNIESINTNISRVVWIVVAAVLASVLKLVLLS